MNGWNIWILLTSLCVGSFVGVVVTRLPHGGDPLRGRSICPNCGGTLKAIDLVPVVSWLVLRGRCRQCGARIPPFYSLVEVSAAGLALWSSSVCDGWAMIAGAVFGWQLLALGLIDWRTMLLPRALTGLLVVSGLGMGVLLNGWLPIDHVVGGVIGYTAFALAAFAYRHLRGREGLGAGDAKLAAGIGVWVGWQGMPTVVLYAAWAGLLLVAWQRLRGEVITSRTAIPFGPFLALGGWLVWLYGPLAFQASSR